MSTPEAGKLVATYLANGVPIPKGLIPPILHDIEYSIWEAFWELSTERATGMVEGHIRWSAIQSYAQTTGIHRMIFKRIIRAMDGAYLSHKSKENS